jgi:hypothetical protein
MAKKNGRLTGKSLNFFCEPSRQLKRPQLGGLRPAEDLSH